MSPDPVPAAPAAPTAAQPVVAFVVAYRQVVAGVLVAVAFAALAAALYFGNRAFDAAVPPPPGGIDAADTLTAPPTGDALRRTEFTLAALGMAMVAVAFGGVGVTLFAGLPKPTAAARLADARKTILMVGGLAGLILMFLGLVFFIYYFGALVAWLDTKKPPADTYKVLLALLAFVGGAGVAFLAVQPARADERDDPVLRRLVYGSNVALTTLLLVAGLVVLNVVVGLKVPNKIDTTATGVYSYKLADATREFVAGLTTPVKIITTFPDEADSVVADTRRLLDEVRAANPQMVTVEYLSPTVNDGKIKALANRFPLAKEITQSFGLVVTAGEDEKQYAFVGERDLIEEDPSGRGRGGRRFVGEAKLVREMVFLAENKVRAAVYFTTGHGELDVAAADPAAGPDAAGTRPAPGLKTALDAAYADAKPLAFDLAKPAVPADAAVVVVADPRAAFRAAEIDALRTYMRDPRAGGKKGKLIVMSSPSPKPDGTGVVDTGLAPLLAEFGVALGDGYLFAVNARSGQVSADLTAAPTRAAVEARNPVAAGLSSGVLFRNCRPVAPAPAGAGGLTTEVVLVSVPTITWVEPDRPADPGQSFAELIESKEAQRRKQATERSRPLGVAVAEAGVGRLVVYGSGEAFAAPARRGAGGAAAELFGLTVNYLRDRPPAADIAGKTYNTYELSPTADPARLLVLPGVAGLAGVAALGVGVWMVRRR